MDNSPSVLIQSWVLRQLSGPAKIWFEGQLEKLETDSSAQAFDITFGMIPRRLGKEDLVLDEIDLLAAQTARPGWEPGPWSLDVAARVLVLVQLSNRSTATFPARFKELQRTADFGELMALYCGLPLYAGPEALVEQAAEGLRTNIKAEFAAVAHDNPFPSEQFAENPWNNMVLKALFIGVMLNPIQGLDQRANPELARILRDYAHERWAADRFVSPELWRCIGPFAEGNVLDDFQRVVDQGNETEQKAAALALSMAPNSERKDAIAAQLSKFNTALQSGELTWTVIADEMLDNALALTRKLNTEVELTR